MTLAPQEAAVVDALAAAFNLYLQLSVEHPSDRAEFTTAIHAAQAIVLLRPGRRDLNSRANVG